MESAVAYQWLEGKVPDNVLRLQFRLPPIAWKRLEPGYGDREAVKALLAAPEWQEEKAHRDWMEVMIVSAHPGRSIATAAAFNQWVPYRAVKDDQTALRRINLIERRGGIVQGDEELAAVPCLISSGAWGTRFYSHTARLGGRPDWYGSSILSGRGGPEWFGMAG